MKIIHGTIYLADLSPHFGTEPGKLRPVLVIQTDLLNETGHPSTLILPCTTRLTEKNILRVFIPQGVAGNKEPCEAMIDQSRSIDNKRFVKALNPLPKILLKEVKEKLEKLGELQENL